MPRPSNTAQRRAQIVRGLLDVMARRGYEGATVAAIAEAAGIAPGLVHYHFETKEEILLELTQHLVATVEGRLVARLARAGDDPARRLDAFIDAYLARDADAEPGAVAAWVLVAAEAVRTPAARSLYQEATRERLERLRRLLVEVLRARGKTTRNATRMAAVVLAAIEGSFVLGTAAPKELPEAFAAPGLRRVVELWIDAEPDA